MLALADTGEKENVLKWCTYVLQGLLKEIEKIDRLLDLDYMTNELLLPTLSYSLDRKYITKREHEILTVAVKSKSMLIRPSDLKSIIGQKSIIQRSRIIKGLREKGMLFSPLSLHGRLYTIGFANTYLLRGIIHILQGKGFIPGLLGKPEAGPS